jgi:hypothetical protein
MEMAHCMLDSKKMKLSFQEEAINYIGHLVNRTPTRDVTI